MRTLPVRLLCFLFFAFTANTFAQNATFPGYYISLKGDTIKGIFPSYRQWEFNPSSISFSTGPTNMVLRPGEAKEIHIADRDVYVSYTGTRLLNPTKLTEDITDADSLSRYDTGSFFLRVVFEWKGTRLLLYESNKRSNFFLENGNSGIYELLYKAYSNGSSIAYASTFRKQLLVTFDKSIFAKDLLNEVNQLEYKENALVKFLQKLTGAPNIKKAKIYKDQVIIEAGASINHIKKLNSNAYPEANAAYKDGVSVLVSASYMLYSQRSLGRLYFSPQLKLYSFKNTGPSKTSGGIPLTSTSRSGILVQPQLNLGYNLVQQENLKWGVSAGWGILLFTDEGIKVKTATGEQASIVYTKNDFKQSINLQTRIVFKNRISGFIAYMAPSKISQFYGAYSNIQLGGGIVF